MKKHQRSINKPKWNEDGQGWRRLIRIANDKLEKFRLNFSRYTNRDIAPFSRQVRVRCGYPGMRYVHSSAQHIYATSLSEPNYLSEPLM